MNFKKTKQKTISWKLLINSNHAFTKEIEYAIVKTDIFFSDLESYRWNRMTYK